MIRAEEGIGQTKLKDISQGECDRDESTVATSATVLPLIAPEITRTLSFFIHFPSSII
jgi:hypothetical protein